MLQSIYTIQDKYLHFPVSATSKNIEEDVLVDNSTYCQDWPFMISLKDYYKFSLNTLNESDTSISRKLIKFQLEDNSSWKDIKSKTNSFADEISKLAFNSYNRLSSQRKQTIERRTKLASYEDLYDEDL